MSEAGSVGVPTSAAASVSPKRARSESAARVPTCGDSATGEQLVPKDVLCRICCGVLNDAHQAPCCGQLACLDCLDGATAKSETCPFCRAALAPEEGIPDRRADRHAGDLMQSCINFGCSFKGKRADLKTHRPECPHDHKGLLAQLNAKHALLQSSLESAWTAVFTHLLSAAGSEDYTPALAFSKMGMHCHIIGEARRILQGQRLDEPLGTVTDGTAVAGLPRTQLRIEKERRTVRFTIQRLSADAATEKEWQRVVVVLIHPTDLSLSRLRPAAIPPKQNEVTTFANWVSVDDLGGFINEGGRLVIAVGKPSAAKCFEL
eukprot:CAMPEP_0174834772 /NCGR_PEP_ID=MMETSP1114-20130205/5036_1 /TAXON_ID=312471 /ORGANISM="Neobodo designis, Strain CCAP 1951/1" /LENGTH=318 /DNA_ID=CAMNT_0016068701 /DNA_START=23 /DNA_END=979 /DNA_ORIENTATION=-